MVFISWDKGLSNFLTSKGSDGNILQIGIVTAQSSGSGYGLIIYGMNPLGLGVEVVRKSGYVGVFELL